MFAKESAHFPIAHALRLTEPEMIFCAFWGERGIFFGPGDFFGGQGIFWGRGLDKGYTIEPDIFMPRFWQNILIEFSTTIYYP